MYPEGCGSSPEVMMIAWRNRWSSAAYLETDDRFDMGVHKDLVLDVHKGPVERREGMSYPASTCLILMSPLITFFLILSIY